MARCSKCNTAGRHYCPVVREYVTPQPNGDVLTSAVIGAVTGSTLLGGILGGSFTGALLGDALDGDIFDDDWGF